VNHLRLELADDKHLRLTGISPLLAHCLFELPEILRLRDQPEPHQRLFPDPLQHDAESSAEWHRLMDDDLQHLFASAEEIVIRDLTQFDRKAAAITFPADHANAWMSALNQARLVLGAKYNVTEADMDDQDLDLTDPRKKALLQIHLFGWVLQHFVDHEQEDAV
jgi:hypothetical protein